MMPETRPMTWFGEDLDNWTEVLDENGNVVDLIENDSPGCDVHYDPETGEQRI